MPPEPAPGPEPLDRVVAVAGLLLFAATFLPWFTYSLDGGGVFRDTSSTVSGWQVGLGWGGLPAVLGLASAGIVLAARWSDEPLRLPLTSGARHLCAGGVAAALVTLKLLVGQHHGVYDVSRSFGLYVATAAALVLAGAGFVRFQQEQGAAR